MINKYKLENIDIVNTTFLIVTPFFAALLAWLSFELYGFNWSQIILAIVFYIITGISITAGYHRLFSHRTYKAHWVPRLFFLCFGAATFQNSALKWCSDHRRHHTQCDGEQDPYSIKEGFFHAHIGWIFLKPEEEYINKYPKDLANDPLIKFQDKYIYPIGVFFGFILPTIIGHFLGSALQGFALAGLCRIVFVHHTTFFINSACHKFGTQPYMEDHTAKDSVIMALLTNGEGYHNFHHSFQADYRNGIRWYHYDPSKWLIYTMSKLGLAKGLKITPQKRINAAIAKMKFKSREIKLDTKLLNA
jgi:stearoyl-CoA desaturase (delta-9 desaturase)